jgi:hypothetical protein
MSAESPRKYRGRRKISTAQFVRKILIKCVGIFSKFSAARCKKLILVIGSLEYFFKNFRCATFAIDSNLVRLHKIIRKNFGA